MKFFTLTPEQILLIAQSLEYARQNPHMANVDDQRKLQAMEAQFRASLKESF